MNFPYPKSILAGACVIGVLLLAVGGCYLRMRSSRFRAIEAARSVHDCRRIAMQIIEFKASPRRADLRSQSDTELARSVETAADLARMPDSAISRIDPGEPRRVSNSDYKDQSTEVEIRPVTLPQLVTFVDAVTGNQDGIGVDFIWLTSPNTSKPSPRDETETWNAQLTLKNLIFSPRS